MISMCQLYMVDALILQNYRTEYKISPYGNNIRKCC